MENTPLRENFYSETENAETLLKLATTQKQDGKILKAIEVLRSAYALISRSEIDYGIDVFLRLPLYLQFAKQNDNAWLEFNHLLTNGYPNMQLGDAAWHQMESNIYDKMRLFLQREGKPKQAVIYGALSFISMQRANLLGSQKNELFKQYFMQSTTSEALVKMFSPLLKKAKITEKSDAFLQFIQNWVSSLPNANDADYEQSLFKMISE